MQESETNSTGGVPVWRWAIGRLGGIFLGLVLLLAAYAKAIHPALFVEDIQVQGLDFLIPATAVAYLALAIEIGIGTALVLGVDRPWMLWLSAALVTFFVFLNARTYWLASQGLLEEGVSCGCFGNLVVRTPAEAFWQDLFLLVPPLLLAFWGRSRVWTFPSVRVATAVLLALAGVGFASVAPDLPLDDWATRLSPGVHVDSLCLGGPKGDPNSQACLVDLIPEIRQGVHLVIMTDLKSPQFVQAVEQINQYIAVPGTPKVWVAAAATENEIFSFTWEHGSAFDIREVPEALMKPFYRRLPRSFRVQDGVVAETYDGLPPLATGSPAGP